MATLEKTSSTLSSLQTPTDEMLDRARDLVREDLFSSYTKDELVELMLSTYSEAELMSARADLLIE